MPDRATPPLSDPDPQPNFAALIAARPALALQAPDGLMMERVPLDTIVERLGTPAWVISAGTIRTRIAALQAAMTPHRVRLCYAVKANDHLAVLRLMAGSGLGADVVSLGELRRAQAAGIAATAIVLSGVGKTASELQAALAAGIGQLNVESAEELTMLSALAASSGHTARITLRVNPDIDAPTLDKIATGRAGDKFGIPYKDIVSLYDLAATLPGIACVGLSVHIGSQIAAAAPFHAAYTRLAGLVGAIRAAGHRVSVVDCGGGLAIGYADQPEAAPQVWADAIAATLGGLGLDLMVEPGRWIVGPAGVLLASVVIDKQAGGQRFVVLDAAMTDLARPALYGAYHGLVPLAAADLLRPRSPADVVGPVCESTDRFARARLLPKFDSGARVAFLDTGAYGAVMSSTYNARPLAPIALVDGGQWALVRARQTVEALWAAERVPAWLIP